MGYIKMVIFKPIIKVFKSFLLITNLVHNYVQFYLNNVNIGKNWIINGRLFIRNSGNIIIGRNFKANSSDRANPIGGDTVLKLVVRDGGILSIGNDVGISNSTIVCWNEIKISNYVFIGGSCKIWDTDFHCLDPIERRHSGDLKVKTSPIIIKDYAFIGGSSIILKGVTIGRNSIIGAGSVVSKDIPDNEIWGGNPARFIKKI